MAWERHGECNRCGWCCEKIARDVLVRTDEQVARDAPYYAARGFKRLMVDGEPRHVLWAWIESPCPQLMKKSWYGGIDYRCRVQDDKPQTCTDFPRLPQDIVGTPCSYWFTQDGKALGGSGSPHPSDVAALLAEERIA